MFSWDIRNYETTGSLSQIVIIETVIAQGMQLTFLHIMEAKF